MRTLRIHLCPLAELQAESPLEFDILDRDRRVVEHGTAVPAGLPRLPRVELVVAAPDVLLIDVALPRLSGARLRAALPGLAEPALVGDVEHAFVAASRPDAAGRATLAVVDRALLRRALDLLGRLKMAPVSATPEPLTLALRPGTWRVRPGRCLRMSERLGAACSPGEPPVELRLALEQAGRQIADARPDTIEVEGELDTAAAWEAELGVKVHAVVPERARAEPVALELLQYEFAPRIVEWRAWRLPATLAAALALVWIAGLNVDAWLKLREERALRGRMNAAFRSVFPQVPVVLDPVAQMRRGIADLRAGAGTGDASDFVALTASFAQVAQLGSESVRDIEYRDRALHVRFEPRAVDTSAKRDALVQRLTKAGFSARFSDATLSVRKGRQI
jgi:general secretion pathway protein L